MKIAKGDFLAARSRSGPALRPAARTTSAPPPTRRRRSEGVGRSAPLTPLLGRLGFFTSAQVGPNGQKFGQKSRLVRERSPNQRYGRLTPRTRRARAISAIRDNGRVALPPIDNVSI